MTQDDLREIRIERAIKEANGGLNDVLGSLGDYNIEHDLVETIGEIIAEYSKKYDYKNKYYLLGIYNKTDFDEWYGNLENTPENEKTMILLGIFIIGEDDLAYEIYKVYEKAIENAIIRSEED